MDDYESSYDGTEYDINTVIKICGDEGLTKFPSCFITVDDTDLRFLVDSCAWYTIIALDVFHDKWTDKVLSPPDVSPGGYTGHKIDLVGLFWANLVFSGRHTFGKIYVARSGWSLLGWPHQQQFGIRLDPKADPPVYAVESSHNTIHRDNTGLIDKLLEQFPSVFSGS